MKTPKGLWIDRRKTVIVTMKDNGDNVKEIICHAEKQLGRIAGVRLTTPYEAQHVPAGRFAGENGY